MPPAAMRSLPPPRFRARAVLPRVTLVPPGMPPRMPPPPMNPAFGPIRLRLPPLRPVGVSRPNGLLPLFPPRTRGYQGAPGAPMIPPMGSRGSGVPRGPLIRPWPRIPPPQMMPPMRPRFGVRNGQIKGKPMNNVKKVNKLEVRIYSFYLLNLSISLCFFSWDILIVTVMIDISISLKTSYLIY